MEKKKGICANCKHRKEVELTDGFSGYQLTVCGMVYDKIIPSARIFPFIPGLLAKRFNQFNSCPQWEKKQIDLPKENTMRRYIKITAYRAPDADTPPKEEQVFADVKADITGATPRDIEDLIEVFKRAILNGIK